MSGALVPSQILGTFTREVDETFPRDERAKLDAHRHAIDATTSTLDHERARTCAVWAIKSAEGKSDVHPAWKVIKELHKLWKDTWFGAEFGFATPHSGVTDDVMIQWTENAVDVAAQVAADEGWATSEWERLLVDLIAMEP